MKSVTQGNIKMAVSSLRTTKMRSLLTMLGVVIGIVSVITVVSIGEGVKQQVLSQINQLGKDLITVRPGQIDTSRQGLGTIGLLGGINRAGSLSTKDVQAVQQSGHVGAAAPLSVVGGRISGTPGHDSSIVVVGTNPDLPAVLNQSMAFGSFFTADDVGVNTAVIGNSVAQKLFGEDVPLGQSFTFHGEDFVIRGIFNQFHSSPLSSDVDFNNAIFIPYNEAQTLTNNSAAIYEILARPSDSKQTQATANSINASLTNVHGGQQDFTVLKQNENFGVTNNVLTLFTDLIGGIAAISLLVGGIGIMDVMLVSVTERMHEIGIRKAVGATNRQIMSQFIIEATALSVFGGILGIILAFVVDFLLHVFTSLSPVITWQVVVLATGVSLVIGVVFGTAPAIKAARKDPIDALRNE